MASIECFSMLDLQFSLMQQVNIEIDVIDVNDIKIILTLVKLHS